AKIDGYSVISRKELEVNSQLSDKSAIKWKSPNKENHFWFEFSAESKRKITELKSGNYPCSRIILNGSAKINGEYQRIKKEFIIVLSKNGKNKSSISENIGMKRFYDKTRCLLKNPGNNETIEFSSGFEDLTVEVASPNFYWKEEPKEAQWEISYDESIYKDKF